MFRFRPRSNHLLVVACAGLYLGAAAQARTERGSRLAVAVAGLTSPVLATANWIGVQWENATSGAHDLSATLADYRRLRREVSDLRRTNQILASEVTLLRQGSQLLAAFPSVGEGAVLARVVGRDVLGAHAMRLDRGSRDTVRLDAPVIADHGVVGRVDRVYPDACRVQLLSHPAAAAAARVVGVEGETLLTGGDRTVLTGLPPYTEVPEDAPVVTTGSEGIYPSGLLLGTTGTARTEGFFTVVPVRLAVHPAEVSVVLVLGQGRVSSP